MTEVTAKDLRALGFGALPHIRFDRRERYFPIRAESWLTHASSAPWAGREHPGDVAALTPDPHHRGTALCTADADVTNVRQLAGAPNPDDAPLRPESDGGADAIGNPDYRGTAEPDAELFLDFAGWANPAAPQDGGDLDYLYRAFSELASAMNHEQPWELLATDANRPRFGQHQPPSPAVYCEIDWAGAHARVATAAGLSDFAGATATRLDGYLQVTYNFLFAAREPLAAQGSRPIEGQWAAISLFYAAAVEGRELDETHRPRRIDVRDLGQPAWLVLSSEPGDQRPTSTVWRVGEQTSFEGGRVGVWTTAGTHRFLPAADPSEASPAEGEPWPPLEYEPGSDIEGLGLVVLFGSALGVVWDEWPWWAWILGLPLIIALVAGLLVGLIIALLMALISLLTEIWDDDMDQSDIPHPPDPPVSTGPEAGNPAAGTPVGETDPAAGGGSAPGAWPTNAGSAQGWDVPYFDVRVVSRLSAIDQGEKDLQPPAWWHYSGRWGIKVPQRADRKWESGTRRTDHLGRSWAYWQANDLLTRLVQEAPTPDAP
ncbi:hypothetical protein [Sphingomonas sp.]|uniref:hypothetical protein n=1 Tax=Sphingomonas sp. TaxID=28214 RepID=UPI0017B1D76F|nr:hypothetical protein [Sphingomonas sp.]MBA3512318.1 hypothetical protein [Sphingomonas sp.]